MKKVIIVLLSLVLLSIAFFAFIIISDMKEASELKEVKSQQKQKIVEEIVKKEKQAEENGMGDLLILPLYPMMLKEQILEVIHSMSHQKVVADDKWSHIPLIEETIDQLYYFLQRDNLRLREDERYFFLNMITKWKNKDFSGTLEVHNATWSMLGGTIGEANDLMSKEDEKKYIIEAFGEDFLEYLIETNQWEE